MFNLILAAALLVLATIGSAQAQTLATDNSLTQQARGEANNVNAPVFNMPANSPFTAGTIDQHVHTNQASAAAPAFGVQGYGCAKPGSGASLQLPGAGGALAIAGDNDPACEAPRDINTMKMAGGFSDQDYQRRACAVPAIAKASPTLCKRLTGDAAMAEGYGLAAPVAQRPAPWQAGG